MLQHLKCGFFFLFICMNCLGIVLFPGKRGSLGKVIAGSKISVRKNDRYADAGDEITLKDHVFIIENVYPQQLKEVTEQDAKQEGFEDLDDYKEALTSIHQDAVWSPDQVVLVHEFKGK